MAIYHLDENSRPYTNDNLPMSTRIPQEEIKRLKGIIADVLANCPGCRIRMANAYMAEVQSKEEGE